MDYHLIVLLHRLLVTLFLLHYALKTFLLLGNKTERLAAYVSNTRIAEIIISFGFLVTGIYLAFAGPPISTLQIIKFVCVFSSIPLAIIGFKRNNKALASLAVVLIILAYGLAEMNKAANKRVDTNASAEQIYKDKCSRCHGENGNAGFSNARNLQTTTLNEQQMKDIIRNGVPNTQMSGFPALTDEQVNGLVVYIKNLKK